MLDFREAAATGEPRGSAPGELYETIEIDATEDRPFQFNIPMSVFIAPDENPDDLVFEARTVDDERLPDWIQFREATIINPNNGTVSRVIEFEGTPLNDHVGLNEFELIARDCAGTEVVATFNVSVANVNDGPIARGGSGNGAGGAGGAGDGGNQGAYVGRIDDQFVEAREPHTFTLPQNTFVDPDAGDSLTLTVSTYVFEPEPGFGGPLPAWLNFDPATWTFSSDGPGDEEVVVPTLSKRLQKIKAV